MKTFILIALAAVAYAEPEAESQYLGYGYNTLGYSNLASPYLGSRIVSPYSTLGYSTLGYNTLGYRNLGYRTLYKREAESDAESYYPYTYGALGYSAAAAYRPLGYAAATTYGYGLNPYSTLGYRSLATGYRLYKREAEAEADSQYLYRGYSALPATTYGYGLGLRSYATPAYNTLGYNTLGYNTLGYNNLGAYRYY